jgi:hypothetical protein
MAIIVQLGFSKVCSLWVPWMLTVVYKERYLLHKFDSGDESFMLHICMGDETWVDNSEPKPKWYLMEW